MSPLSPRKLTVLLSSAGRRVELLECFRKDARELGIDLRVIAVDAQAPFSSACHLADQSFSVPHCRSNEFLTQLLEICRKQKVNILIPTIDTELEALAMARDEFRAEGVTVSVSSPDVVRLARNKLDTVRFLNKHGLPAPRTELIEDLFGAPHEWNWPVILKPIDGSSSFGIFQAESVEHARAFLPRPSGYVAQELLIGREYTVNMFFSEGGKLLCSVPHLRRSVRGGEVNKGITERHSALIAISERLGRVLPGARGAICFQAMVKPSGEAVVFEINARFGGGFPLAHRAGAPFSKWLLEETAGLPLSAHDGWRDNMVMLRYDESVFVQLKSSASSALEP